MAHAEMDALFVLKEKEHPDIKSYILYSTMEPCPMCFGTAVMMNIRHIFFAARDSFAGATALNDKLDYIRSKNIVIRQGNEEMEAFQLILLSAYEFQRQLPSIDNLLNAWKKINEKSVEYGKMLFNNGYFNKAISENKHIGQIYDEIIAEYLR